jgi:hypothetical protein
MVREDGEWITDMNSSVRHSRKVIEDSDQDEEEWMNSFEKR